MASVCGSTLALMDAGIQIKAPVAGIAMGLMSDGKTFKVLTDIIGMEDFCGDMDFKVAGTRKGINALQLDTKLEGIPDEVLSRALAQAKTARFQILDVIEAEISAPRTEVASSAPQVTTIKINPEKIGAVIGPGGAVIKKMTAETGASIDIQQDGTVLVGGTSADQVNDAIARIRALTEDIAVGTEFMNCTVTRLMGRGAMVEYIPGKEGLIPTDHLIPGGARRPDDVVQLGEKVNVKVFEVDSQGRINLTALGVAQDHPNMTENEKATPPAGFGGGGGGGGRFGGGGGRGGDRDRGRGGDRGGRDGGRGGDRGGRGGGGGYGGGGRDRGPRDDRGPSNGGNDAPVATQDRAPERAPESAPEVPDAFPTRDRGNDGDDNVNARFRPRR
jgi:polyribonucleotide nucleotidyltransferase